jgi:lipoprotein signal peptidase
MQSQISQKKIKFQVAIAWSAVASLLLFLIDRLLKNWATQNVNDQGGWFYYFANQGGVFSLPLSQPSLIALAALALAVVGGFGVWAYQRNNSLVLLAAGLMFVGGYSNLLDRLSTGVVIDYWHLSSLSFNLADIYLLVGLGLMIL